MSKVKVCSRMCEVQVLKSRVGYYIGTYDPVNGPICRISGYYEDPEVAISDLSNMSFQIRESMESIFCSRGRGCFHDPNCTNMM